MTGFWTDTIAASAGQVVAVVADVTVHDMSGLLMRLHFDLPGESFDMDYTWDGDQFVCVHPDTESLVSLVETLIVNTAEPSFHIEAKVGIAADGDAAATLHVITANADVDNASLAVE